MRDGLGIGPTAVNHTLIRRRREAGLDDPAPGDLRVVFLTRCMIRQDKRASLAAVALASASTVKQAWSRRRFESRAAAVGDYDRLVNPNGMQYSSRPSHTDAWWLPS